MKTLFTLLFTLLLISYGTSQNYTSANNGNWTNPLSWSPMGVPLPGANVTINHAIILDTDFAYTSGSITINSGGSLTENVSGRNFGVSGGSLNNDGSFTISNLGITTGTVTNTGTLSPTLLLVGGTLINTGVVNQCDSLHITGSLTNNATGSITALAMLSDGLTNNNASIQLNNFQNSSKFYNTSTLICTVDFTNNNVQANGTAMFDNSGAVTVQNDWSNTDSIVGNSSGYFCVANASSNSGFMLGNFDFCDNTPPVSSPFIDVNTGTVDPLITFCASSACGSTAVNELKSLNNLTVSPNPVAINGILKFNDIELPAELSIYDVTGKKIVTTILTQDYFPLSSKLNDTGIYFIEVKSNSKVKTAKVIVQ